MATNKLSSEVFYWDAPRRRLHKRDLFPLQMEINGSTYFVPQWTLKHFKIVDYSGEVKLGEVFAIKPIVKFRDFNIQFDATAIPLHYNEENQELIAIFKDVPEEHKELLKYFSEALSSGDMVNIDNVLRRVDMPVTPASTTLAEVPEKKNKSQKIKRSVFASLYLLMGAGLLLFIVSTLSNSFFRLTIETAFVNSPVIPVQAHNQGSVKDILVTENEVVSLGQPLLILDVSGNDRLPKQYRVDAAKQQAVLYQALIDDNNKKTKYQTNLSQTKVNAAYASLQASTLTRNVKCNRRYATVIDRRNPRKRNAECQIARKKVTAARAKLRASKAYLMSAKQSYKNNAQADDGNKKSVAVLQAKLEQAQQKLKAIENTPESLSGTETIYSPIAGKIIKIVDLKNQYIKKGHLIAVIQKPNSEQFIEAHITHEDATKLRVGNKAIAYSPSLPRDYAMIIEQVDLTSGVILVNNVSLVNNPIDNKKTAKIILKFLDKKSETLLYALPVKLSIEKQNSFTTKIKESIASLFNLFIGEAHADSLLPVRQQSYCSIYTPDPNNCQSATHLFPQNFIDNIKEGKSNANARSAVRKHLLNIDWEKRLLKKANGLLKTSPTPIGKLQSSGITNAKNKALKKTRKALRDAQNTALLALAYYITDKKAYLTQAKKYLLAWAETHQPNGHPINETRLEGFLWAYDLLYCQFNRTEHRKIKIWLLNLQANKHNWKFGPSSGKNNLRTHQLKILLMVDRLLEDEKSLNADRETLRKHIDKNLLKGGISIDYQERDALHYHVYNLEPWLEIALLEPQYLPRVKASYDYLIKQVKDGNIHNQFANSKQKIDRKRAKGGFSYAKKGGSFDTKRITRSVIVFNTQNQEAMDGKMLKYMSTKKARQSLLFHYIRYYLWEIPQNK